MRILFVDDEELIRESLTVFFQRNGFEVLSASNGLEALQVIDQEKIDLIFTDTQMPKCDGIGLLNRLKQQGTEIPVFVISGYGDIKKDAFIEAGAEGFIEKPLNRKWLVNLVRQRLSDAHLVKSQ